MSRTHKRKIEKLLCVVLAFFFLVVTLPGVAYSDDEAAETESENSVEVMEPTSDETELQAGSEQGAGSDTSGSGSENNGDSGDAPESQCGVTYANSISGLLWLDANTDGTFDNGELPVIGYPVSLYTENDLSNAVRTTTTDAEGKYKFTDIEPGTYIVGIKAEENGMDYLLPLIGVTGDNRFGTWSNDYTEKYSDSITVNADAVVADIDAAMRTPAGGSARGTFHCSYSGRLIDENGDPLCHVTFAFAILYNGGLLPGDNPTHVFTTVTSNNHGYFYAVFNNLTGQVKGLLGGDSNMYFLLLFPKSTFSTSMTVQSSSGTTSTPLTIYNGLRPQFSTGRNYGLTLLNYYAYLVAQYEIGTWDTTVVLEVTPHQNIQLNTSAYTVTENYYILDTTTPIEEQNITSYLFIYASGAKTFTPAPPSIISCGTPSITYTYAGYLSDTASGTPELGIPGSFAVTEDTTINYYYAAPAIAKEVTIEYVSMDGSLLATQPSPNVTVVNSGSSFTHDTVSTVAGSRAVYYTLSTDMTQTEHTVSLTSPNTISIDSVIEDVTITVYYVSTMIDVTVPSSVEFYATMGTNGVVTPDAANGKATAMFQNNSELPLQVSLKQMTVDTANTSSKVNVVDDVTNPAYAAYKRIHFDIVPATGFTTGVSNIIPDTAYSTPVLMGTLDGKYYTEADVIVDGSTVQVTQPGTGTGSAGGIGGFEVGGQYEGGYPSYASRYIIDVDFTFQLELIGD